MGSVGTKGNGGMFGMLGNGNIGVNLEKGPDGGSDSSTKGNVGDIGMGLEGTPYNGAAETGFNCDDIDSELSCFIDASSFRPAKG